MGADKAFLIPENFALGKLLQKLKKQGAEICFRMLARVLLQYLLKITCPDFNSRRQMGRKKLKRKSKKKIALHPGKQSQSSKSALSMDALSRAVEYYRSGRLQEAAALCDGLLQENPDNPAALHLLGVIAFQRGENKAAVELIEKAIEINPSDPEFYNNLGLVFINTGKSDAALEHFHKALELKPDFADAYSNLGTVLKDQGRLDEAIECYRKAMELKPDLAEAYSNLGNALKDQGRFDEAIECYRNALELKPDYAEAYSNLGNALMDQERFDEAIECYRKALELKPDLAGAYSNLGNALRDQGRFDEAIECYRKALELIPDFADAYSNLGNVLKDQGNIDEALENYHQALKIKPDYALAHSNFLLSLHYDTSSNASHIFSEHQRWTKQHASTPAPANKIHANNRSPDRPLRIGYVSPDFRRHSVAFFFEPILTAHNRNGFEIICYPNICRPDEVTGRLQDLADAWRNIFGMTDEEVCRMIRKDRIDILVDLAGHTSGNRLLIFSQKPAPVQVTYLGYPNTTGLPTMDYRITDYMADPIGQPDAFYTEKLVRLPQSFLCYQPPPDSPEAGALSALETGWITFGSFNNRSKITPKVVNLWSTILKGVPNAQLILKSKSLSDAKTRQFLKDMFVDNGIHSERVELHGHVPSPVQHLQLYNRIDIGLDTFPYNGTTTTCEALWMGVPVIVLTGDRHVSRVGVSLLSNVGLRELIAESTEDYVKKAVQLANDQNRLKDLRADLRSMMTRSPLMNAKGLTRSLEEAYRQMWHGWIEKTGVRGQGSGVRSREPGVKNQLQGYYSEKKNIEHPAKMSLISKQAVSINRQGEDFFNAGHIDDALTAFKKAIKIESDYVVAHNNLGVLYWNTGEVNFAMDCFKKALEIDPGHPDTILNLTGVLKVLKQRIGANSINPSCPEPDSDKVNITSCNE